MNTEGGLLEKACEGVLTLERPACVKDSQLRYVCANAAYARFAGRAIDDFQDKTSHELFGTTEDLEREDKEKRCLVFATDETTIWKSPVSGATHVIKCERFETEDGGMFLYEVFETMPSSMVDVGAGLVEKTISIPSATLDLLDVAIGIYGPDNTLVYANARLESLCGDLSVVWRPGLELKTVIAAFHDYCFVPADDSPETAGADRQAWIDGMFADAQKPFAEFTQKTGDGHWVRGISRRLESGMLVALLLDVTDARTQEILLEKHTRENWLFREALEQLPVAVFMLDGQRRLTYANASYEALWGEPREKNYGRTEEEIFVHEGQAFRQENIHVLKTGEELHKTEQIVLNDGTIIPTIIRVGRIITPAHEPYLVGSVTDATPLMKRKEELKAARNEAERLHAEVQSILQSLPVGVMLLGSDYTIEYANNYFYELWEATEQVDLIGLPYRRYLELGYKSGKYHIGASDVDSAIRDREAHLAQIDGYSSREVESKAGRFTIISECRIAGNKILLTFSDSTDVRSRDREISHARQELQRVGEHMRDATRVMAQGLALVEKGRIIMSNDAMVRLFEVPEALLAAGESWIPFFSYCAARGDFGSEEQIAKTKALWTENVATIKPFSWLIHLANGRWLNLEATIGAGDYWLVIVTDVTDMKQREVELEGLLARAKAADRAKSEFLANMSHEIRTPMNGVLGMAELLAKSNLDTRQRTFTDVIVKSGNALLTIINDILDFSKIDAGQMTLRAAPFDAVEAVEDVASLLSSQAQNKNIELIVRVDPSFNTMVSGDAGRFRQIVTNLTGNAIKFTERGHVLIELSAEPVDESEVILVLRVKDTGIGIPPHQLDHIFEKFNQADSSSTRRHEGTGLGLAITVGLVGIFGGKVDVESTIGEGSTFTVALPLRVVAKTSEQTSGAIDRKKVSVLIIDDNSANRQILSEQLSSWDIDAYAAESGPTGLAILEEATRLGFEIDAVILDDDMPGMNGLEVARRVRQNPSFNETAMIFLTSMDAIHQDSEPCDISFDAHLMKPVRARLLRKTLTDVVRTSRSKRALRKTSDTPEHLAEKTTQTKPVVVTKPSTGSEQTSRTALIDVLIAEDNDVNQIVFTQILQETGLRFHIVSNGKKAVEAWRDYNPSIILMDVSMPVMNGLQATQTIRAEEKSTARTPIIGVTAHAQDSDRELCLTSGMDDYLSKPISPELLRAKIDKWLLRRADDATKSKSN
ncbi:response regulator [Agrobacterium sp. rho-8.1]|nr:response regulator [Agrobacterium sp. rho-8.1]